MTDLNKFGWNQIWETQFTGYAAQGLEPARICAEFKNMYRLYTANGDFLAEVAGKLRYQASGMKDYPAVGDWVAVKPGMNEGKAVIEAVLPRKSSFSRKLAGVTTEEQIVAANFDTIFIMMSLNHDFNPRRLERYAILAWDSGANPVIILSKADLDRDAAAKASLTAETVPGVPVHVISSYQGTGFEEINTYFKPGSTIVVLGSSGVGKSTLVNTIAGEEILKTQSVRETDDHGRHTTTHRQLVLLSCGAMVIDTPGMREIGIWETDDGLSNAFPDIEELALQCRFKDSRHLREPGCAVMEAIQEGRLEETRLASYLKLQKEALYMAAKQNERLRLEQKRRMKQLSTLAKNFKKG